MPTDDKNDCVYQNITIPWFQTLSIEAAKMDLWPFIFLLLSAQVVTQQSIIYVPTVDDDGYGELLEYYLCDDAVSSTLSNTTLLLSTAGTHALNQSCVIKSISGLIIASNNSNSAVIDCDTSLGGIVFYNVTELAVSRIHVINCSAPLPTDIAKYDNKSTFYFGPGQKSTLYFSNCENISIKDMLFHFIHGLSLLVVNSFSAILINNVTIIESNNAGFSEKNVSYVCAGSGLVFYYHDHMMVHTSQAIPTASIIICNCTFINNSNAYFKYSPCCTRGLGSHNGQLLLTAAALSFLFTQGSSNVSVSIEKGNFSYNNPLVVLATFSNIPGLASVFFRQINMTKNFGFAECTAVCITIDYITADKDTFIQDRPLKFNNFSLIHQEGLVYIRDSSTSTVTTDLIFEHFHCEHVNAKNGGICVIAESVLLSKANAPLGKLHIYFSSVKIFHNKGMPTDTTADFSFSLYYSHAVFLFINIDHVVIEGLETDPSMFCYNHATAVTMYNSNLILKGSIIFNGNHGAQGGALALYDSYLILMKGADVIFNFNTANIDGGAIYAYNDPTGYYDTPCVIQFNTTDLVDNTNIFKITLQNNVVFDDRGLIVSISPAYDCSQTFSPVMKSDLKYIYNNITNTSQAVIRSTPAKIGFCNYTGDGHFFLSFGIRTREYYIYSGIPIKVSVAAVDMGGNIVPGEVYARVVPHDGHAAMHLNYLDTHKSFAHTDKCSNFTYRIYLKGKDGVYKGKLPLYLRNTDDLLILSFQIRQCPLGYALSSGGACQCNSFFDSLSKAANVKFRCWIDLKPHKTDCGYNSSNCIANVSVTSFGWIGMYSNNNAMLAFTHSCPFGNCKIHQHSADLFQPDGQCIGNRRGQVCSECRPGYSVAFGTKHCMKCSNIWLLTILLYAVLGLVLVLFLFIAHFTIDQGTVVGIVLFGNLYIFVLSKLYDTGNQNLEFSKAFISMLNLDLGIPVCFYDGMTDGVKIAFQFVFPVYVWSIVLFLILISKQSMSIANLTSGNSVQVLITLVHLSFVKILKNVIHIFSPLKLYHMTYTNSTLPYGIDYVWYSNATIPYGGTVEHCLLLVAASVFTIGFLLPYVVMSFAAPYCLRFRVVNHFRPIYETQYGPYKDKYRYWFGVRVMLLVIFCVIYILTEGTDYGRTQIVIDAFILIIFFPVQCWIKPFKTMATNVIDSFYVGTVTIVYCAAQYVALSNHETASYNSGKVFTALVFTAFVMTVIYHIAYFVSPVNHFCTLLSDVISRRLQDIVRGRQLPLRNVPDDRHPTYGAMIQRSYNDSSYREPLLSCKST